MIRLKELTQFLETIAPLHLQESYDNAGLIVGNTDMEVRGVTVCLDSTEQVVEEAIDRGHNVIVAHHPIVFSGLKSFTGQNYIERTIIKAIKNDIAIYAIHTNLDNVLLNGVNERIAQQLNLSELEILSPKMGFDSNVGAGIIGYTSQDYAPLEFLAFLKNKMQTSCVKYTDLCKEKIEKVAICGGSGSFLLDTAIRQECDLFITGDFKYHQFFDANNQIIIADIGHFESERYTIDLIKDLINNNFTNFAAHCTKVQTNPVNYL